jgi:putative ubiquitin-RnfH superfamily antitoxin RatB of RatAB toxin-antitoxin module
MADPSGGDAVEVVYATADRQDIVAVPFTPGLTAERAARLSGLPDAFPAINDHPLVLGVFGAQVARNYVLAPGDRVEICRPLLRDPRDRRRDLALKKPVGRE